MREEPNDDWPQEPHGFHGLNFGSTKGEVEKQVTIEWLGESGNHRWPPDAPSQTFGTTHLNFANVDLMAHLAFTQKDGLCCIQGTFPTKSV